MSRIGQNNITYDRPRKEEIQKLIDKLEKITKINGEIDYKTIYTQLMKYGVKNQDIDEDGNLKYINDNCISKLCDDFKTMDIQLSSHFCEFSCFIGLVKDWDFIKLYIPIDSEHFYLGTKKILEYILNLNIPYMLKIATEIRSDDMVVRLNPDDYESAKSIIDFINTDEYIKEGLTSVNPLLPTIKGIGIMSECGRSYNTDMSEMLSYYLNDLAQKKRYDGNVDEFFEYLKKNFEEYLNLDRIVRGATVNENLNCTIGTFENSITGYQKNEIYFGRTIDPSILSKLSILVDALNATYEKHGYDNVVVGLKKCIEGNYNYITRGEKGDNLREKLEKNLSPIQILILVISTLERIGISTENLNKSEIVEKFANSLYRVNEILNFDEICSVTLKNYNKIHLQTALRAYALDNDIGYFSRYKDGDKSVNYRQKLSKIDHHRIETLLEDSLALNGFDESNTSLDGKIDFYAYILSEKLDMNNQISF